MADELVTRTDAAAAIEPYTDENGVTGAPSEEHTKLRVDMLVKNSKAFGQTPMQRGELLFESTATALIKEADLAIARDRWMQEHTNKVDPAVLAFNSAAASAFTSTNITERSRLVTMLVDQGRTPSQAAAEVDGVARKFGLASTVDMRKGTVPPEFQTTETAKKTTDVNPWKLGPEGHERRVAIISKSTKLAASLAKAAGTDLAGRPLKA